MKYIIQISKTVQERQYEPYHVELNKEVILPDDLTGFELDDKLQEEYHKIEKQVDSWITRRLNKTTEQH